MNKYIGLKILQHAEPMTHGEYALDKFGKNNAIHTTDFSKQNNDSVGYKVVYKDGYVSWSPKDAFEAAYRPITDLTFGFAIEAARAGHRVVRRSWGNTNSFVYYVPAGEYKTQTEAAKQAFGDTASYDAYLAVLLPNGKVTTFIPGMDSILAEDWFVKE
jgi:hypothetical protein